MRIKFDKRPKLGDIFMADGNIYTIVEIPFEEMPFALVNLTKAKILVRSNKISELYWGWDIERIIRYEDVLICESPKE